MRNIIWITLLLILISQVGCTGGQTKNEEKQKLFRVAYIARTLSDPFAAWLAIEMSLASEEYSDIFTLEIIDSKGDSIKQNAIIETCINREYDCIIIQPNDGELQRPYAEKVVAAGIKCITTNAKINHVEGASSVDADPYKQGAIIAESAYERVPTNGRVAIMNALPGNYHCETREVAFRNEFLAKRPDVELLANVVMENVSEAESMAVMEDWVQQFGDIDAILTIGDVIALACIEVVKDDPRYDDLLAYGVDGIASALLSIKAGEQTGTCLQDAGHLAQLNMKAAFELLTGKKNQVDYTIDAIYIDLNNVDNYISSYIDKGLLTNETVR